MAVVKVVAPASLLRIRGSIWPEEPSMPLYWGAERRRGMGSLGRASQVLPRTGVAAESDSEQPLASQAFRVSDSCRDYRQG